jgi:hypothetical protein
MLSFVVGSRRQGQKQMQCAFPVLDQPGPWATEYNLSFSSELNRNVTWTGHPNTPID